jgi:nicotinamidase-related amidase
MVPQAGEYVALKAATSGFAGTGLDAHLRNSGIRHLVLVGVATNMVVEGTTRQVVDFGYQVTILGDGCASFSPELHEFALGVLENLATISTVDEFIAALD